jgi:hypothetical protein
MVIKGAKYARLVVSHVRLQPLEGVFSYKERPLHRTVMPPKPNGTSSWIKNSALIREIEHGSLRFQSSRHGGWRHQARWEAWEASKAAVAA